MPAPVAADVMKFTEKIQHFCNLYGVSLGDVIVVCSGVMLLSAASVGRPSRKPNDIDIAIPNSVYDALAKTIPNAVTIKAPIGTYAYKSIKVDDYQVDFAPRWGGFSYNELREVAEVTSHGLAYAPLSLFLQYKKAMTREKDKQDAAFAEQLLQILKP